MVWWGGRAGEQGTDLSSAFTHLTELSWSLEETEYHWAWHGRDMATRLGHLGSPFLFWLFANLYRKKNHRFEVWKSTGKLVLFLDSDSPKNKFFENKSVLINAETSLIQREVRATFLLNRALWCIREKAARFVRTNNAIKSLT